ncbi:hypothetical protein MKW98_008808 [Papaver atlanticum]|uniref:Uncharacterized protein n=1 Tax=Papaver atlanticum TaxID=357466 RepID=A0AAD4X8X4_9MAGN|nr:hypothetical protein MKW98_008808 [Papaver atlanticum]
MSKSDPSDQSRINLLDPKMLEFGNPDRPECNNLLSVYQPIAGKTKEEVARECHDMDWGEFKPFLTDALVNHLHPTQVLVDGATKAVDIADATLNDVYQAMLLWDSCGDEKNQYCCKNQYESNLEFTCGRSH